MDYLSSDDAIGTQAGESLAHRSKVALQRGFTLTTGERAILEALSV